MAFTLHIQAEINFNKSAYEIVDLVEEKEVQKENNVINTIGSRAEKKASDFTINLDNLPCIVSETINDEKINIYETYKGIQIGLNTINYQIFKKFVNRVYNVKSVSSKVTYEFIFNCAFNWAIRTYKNKKSESDFIIYLQEEVLKVVGDYKYYFKILNLDIDRKFQLGNVEFLYLESTFFDYLKETHSDEEVNKFNEKFSGSVYAAITLKDVANDRGSEIALQEGYQTMNILKFYSKTVYFPTFRTTFDIDRRVTVSEANEHIVQDLKNIKELNINLSAGSIPYALDEYSINSIILLSKNLVTLISIKEPNELQRIIMSAIEKFAEAISIKDLHRRIVDLFTVWESLLLKNDNVNIQDSLIFYGIHFLNIEDKKKEWFGSHIMSLYSIRSQMIHHASRKNIGIDKLKVLQKDSISLIEIFIRWSCKYNTKQLFIEAVDEYLGTSVEKYSKARKKE